MTNIWECPCCRTDLAAVERDETCWTCIRLGRVRSRYHGHIEAAPYCWHLEDWVNPMCPRCGLENWRGANDKEKSNSKEKS